MRKRTISSLHCRIDNIKIRDILPHLGNRTLEFMERINEVFTGSTAPQNLFVVQTSYENIMANDVLKLLKDFVGSGNCSQPKKETRAVDVDISGLKDINLIEGNIRHPYNSHFWS